MSLKFQFIENEIMTMYNVLMNKYELEQRTLDFSKAILNLFKDLPRIDTNKPLMNQLLRSATSIGANYREANGASSKKDFRNKVHICKKEAQETAYWLELLLENNPRSKNVVAPLLDEANQLVLIFGKITSTITKNLNASN